MIEGHHGFEKLDPLLSKRKKKALWARNYAKRRAFNQEFFGGRGDTILEQSKILTKESEVGPIAALDLCMQIEAEFPNRVEEVIDRAGEHPNGRLPGIGQYIRHLRKTND